MGSLHGVQDRSPTTTVRLARETHRDLKERAAQDGLTVDAEIRRLLRYDRQRRMAEAFRDYEPTGDEEQLLERARQTQGTELARAEDKG
jgi:hypothetical protein